MTWAPSIPTLIVDDNRQMRVIVREMLHAFGVRQLLEASTTRQAKDVIAKTAIGLLVTDWALPDEDGVALTTWVRSGSHGGVCTIPIIMMSGHSARSRVETAMAAGVDSFLAKPVSAQTLAHHVRYVLYDRRR